ncbi:hypothetical protein Ddc_12174 [Ditylenchus destructor]|nr:hypothetical protein Ddc_12174 [Ditylenchus destructor]
MECSHCREYVKCFMQHEPANERIDSGKAFYLFFGKGSQIGVFGTSDSLQNYRNTRDAPRPGATVETVTLFGVSPSSVAHSLLWPPSPPALPAPEKPDLKFRLLKLRKRTGKGFVLIWIVLAPGSERNYVDPLDWLQGEIPNIAPLDNGTMVQVFKYLDYCQLATSSLVSKRYRNVIRTHRQYLALLSVECSMKLHPRFTHLPPDLIKRIVTTKIFNKELSPEAYNEWVTRNKYSKLTICRNREGYELRAIKDPNWNRTSVLYACIKGPNRKTWPVFQHFVRLLTDPFVYIRYLELTPQKDVLSLFAKAINSERGRLQCGHVRLEFPLELQPLKFTSWIKDHVRCDELRLTVSRTANSLPNCDKQLLDFFTTGSHCTSVIGFDDFYLPKAVVIGVVQKFMDLKNCDENQIVQFIWGHVSESDVEAWKTECTKFCVTEKCRGTIQDHVIEVTNNDIGKMLELTFGSNYDNVIIIMITLKQL